MIRSLFFLLLTAGLVDAQPQQSENFRITKSVLDAGGGVSNSASFRLVSAFGQPSPVGTQASASFVLHSGFLSPWAQLSPLSPIAALVIQRQTQDIYLNWPAVSGAGLYRIYRGMTPSFTPAPGNLIGSSSGTSYTDTGIVAQPATRYYYIVTADYGTTVAGGMPVAGKAKDHAVSAVSGKAAK